VRVLIVAGARPNFMKVAPVIRACRRRGQETVLVHTGQHYDAAMSDTFFGDLQIPPPDHHLHVGSASHAVQTARIMERFEPVLHEVRPDWVLVPGDVNSTLACSLVAAKLRPELGCRIAHLEAGLRSNDWRMPEEVNRVLTDRLSDLLLTPSLDAQPNLEREGIPSERVRFVGNVMIDTLFDELDRARGTLCESLGLERGEYVACTLHRPSNVDDADRLGVLLEALGRIAEQYRVVLPLHPRTRARVEEFGLGATLGALTILEPLAYREMVSLVDGARVVLTDSGGLQEETTALGIACLTLREQTERPVTVTEGTNRLVSWPPTVEGVLRGFDDAVAEPRYGRGEKCPQGWDGRAAERVAAALAEA
jgi:UDP-N-acetylglucosamine 2-epimerase (non-hydrolysing)